MRVYCILLVLIFCIAGTGYAQDADGTMKRTVEKNKKVDTKTGYNYFLLDMIRDTDQVYEEYEELIQRVWDRKVDLDLHKTSEEPIKKLDRIIKATVEMRVYIGGEAYQKAVLDYIDSVKEKLKYLEAFGIMGVEYEAGSRDYKNAEIIFNDATNKTIAKRNAVRKEKYAYETTVYMKTKKK